MNQAQTLRIITDSVVARKQRDQQATEEARRANLHEDSVKWAEANLNKALITAQEAAARGSDCASYSVAIFADKVTDDTEAKANRLVDLLREEGLTASVSYDRDDPVGSDPMFYTTVYSTSVIMRW